MFAEQKNSLAALKAKIDNPEYAGNPLLPDVTALIADFEHTVHESEKLILFSDRLQKNMNNANQRLYTVNELRSQLIDFAFHDLKNPLTLVLNYLDIMQKQPGIDASWQEMLSITFQAAQRMNELITELLSTERIGDATIALRITKVNVVDVIKSIAGNYQLLLDNKKQVLDFRHDSGKLFFVDADRVLLSEIFDNLISNAIKYSPFHSKISVTVECIPDNSPQPFIRISIKDNGPGFSDYDKRRMFVKFQKLSANPSGNEQAMGLGLYITKKLVDLHDAKLYLESEQGQGSTFVLEMKRSL